MSEKNAFGGKPIDITGGMDAAEYVRMLRDGDEPSPWSKEHWRQLFHQNRDAVAFNIGVVPYTPGCRNPGRRKL